MRQFLDGLPKAMLIAVSVLPIGRAWINLDSGSPAAVMLRRIWSTRLLVSLFALALLAVITQDVIEAERSDFISMLDHALRPVARASAKLPGVRAGASRLSWLTGEGMAFVLLGAALVLYARGRPKELAVILLGTLSAWGASGFFKLLVAIPRPRSVHWLYGFPSGHTFVTLVALGLIAWVAGRRGSSIRRTALMTAAVTTAVLTGCSRLVLDVHWLSDVAGGLALGTVWLNATITLAERRFSIGLHGSCARPSARTSS